MHSLLRYLLAVGLGGRVGRLLADAPGFNRAVLPALYQRIEASFNKHLLP